MKLIIDIDKNVFTRLFDNGIQDNEISVDDVCEMARALRMGTPLSEELEEIKQEITNIQIGTCTIPKTAKDIQYEALWILDKRISELKGENKC